MKLNKAQEKRFEKKFPFGSFAGSSVRAGEAKQHLADELSRQKKEIIEILTGSREFKNQEAIVEEIKKFDY